MYCSNCGNKLSGNSKFCSECGCRVEEVEQAVSSTVISSKETKAGFKLKMKPKLGVLALVLVVLLTVALVTKDYIIYAISPELHTKLALKNTIENIDKDYSKIQSLFFTNNKSNSGNTSNLNVSVMDANHTNPWMDEGLYYIKGMGIDMNTIIDEQNKELYFNGKYSLNGEEIVSTNIKLDDNELLINIPELFNKMVAIPSKDFGNEWNKSVFARETGERIDDSIDISFSRLQEIYTGEELDKNTKEAYINAFKTMVMNADYEKSGKSTLVADGKNKNCNKTVLKLKEEDIKHGILALLDAIKIDNRIKDSIDTGLAYQNISKPYSSGANYEEFQEAVEDLKDEIKEDFQADSVVLTVFTDNKNILKTEINIIPDMEYKEDALYLNIETLGNKSLLDDIKVEIKMDPIEIVYESQGNHIGSGNKFINNSKFRFLSYGDNIEYESSLDIDFSKKTDNFKGNMSFRVIDDVEMNLNVDGDFDSSTKNTQFRSDSIHFSIKDIYSDEAFNLRLSLAATEEQGANGKPDLSNYGKLNLFEASEYDIEEFIYSMEDNIYSLGERMEEQLYYGR